MSSSMILTAKQKVILDFIRKFSDDHEYPPSLKEIGVEFKFTIPTAQGYIVALVNKGYLSKQHNGKRSILLKERKPENLTVTRPILGKISAGYGISLFEEPEPELVEVPATMMTAGNQTYCLKVEGDSMIGDGILNGDIVVIRQQSIANNGDIVVAVIKSDFGEKVTLKRYYLKGNTVELHPRNPKIKKIILDTNQIEIRGKFLGLIRYGTTS
jgi:repressor LexA